jgi:hypothetical protein
MSKLAASRRGWVALWAFPALLWFLATFFLLGDLGLWNDDWMYVQRIPETGAVRSLVLDQEVHYWRPLYRVLQPTLATLLWKHQQLHHLIGAVSHGRRHCCWGCCCGGLGCGGLRARLRP